MKTILCLLVVLLAFFTLTVPAQAQDTYVYHPNSEKCAMARAYRSMYEERGVSVPKHIQNTLSKCDQYAKRAAAQKQPSAGASISGFPFLLFGN